MTAPEFRFLGDPTDIQEAAWVTARKNHGRPFTPELFARYLIAEHSPIRRLVLAWRFRSLGKRASSHLVRHVHSQPYVGGTRPDWFPSLQDPESVDHLEDSNCQALIELARKRLCRRTWKGTREAITELKRALMKYPVDPPGPAGFYRALGQALVPNCVYRCGCPESAMGRGCGWWKQFTRGLDRDEFMTIEARYRAYNASFSGVPE